MSEGMKAQYRILGDLKRVEEKVNRLNREVSRIPEEVAKLDKALSTRRGEFTKVKDSAEASEKNLRKLEQDLREREDKLTKAEGKMMEVKTNEEYQAAIKENQVQKVDKGGMEEKVLLVLSQLEEQKNKLKEAEKEYKAYESVINEDKSRLEAELKKFTDLLNEQLESRNAVTAQLTPEINELYHRVAMRAKGTAIVAAENGMCSGCNMKIRPQLYNEVLGFKFIHRCPSCGRILIIPSQEDIAKDLAEAAESKL